MAKVTEKIVRRERRRKHVRRKVTGTAERPRLSVFRSVKHVYGQIINDEEGVCLVAASTLSKELRDTLKSGGNMPAAREVGKLLGRKAVEKGVAEVVFDRAGYKFHGRVKELAEGARESGLRF